MGFWVGEKKNMSGTGPELLFLCEMFVQFKCLQYWCVRPGKSKAVLVMESLLLASESKRRSA